MGYSTLPIIPNLGENLKYDGLRFLTTILALFGSCFKSGLNNNLVSEISLYHFLLKPGVNRSLLGGFLAFDE